MGMDAWSNPNAKRLGATPPRTWWCGSRRHRERLADAKSSLSIELDDLVRMLDVLYFVLSRALFREPHTIFMDLRVPLHPQKACLRLFPILLDAMYRAVALSRSKDAANEADCAFCGGRWVVASHCPWTCTLIS